MVRRIFGSRYQSVSRPGEHGAIYILTILLFLPLLAILIFSMSMTEGVVQRTDLQRAVDAAASDAAAAFCSTRYCWNFSLIAALQAVHRHHVAGSGFQAELEDEIDRLTDLLENPAGGDLLSPDDNTTWNFDGVQVTVQRGRYWAAATNAQRGRFFRSITRGWGQSSAFENLDDADWQSANPGTPAFIAVNAARVAIREPSFRPILRLRGTPGYAVQASSVMARVKRINRNTTYCSPPFAIPVCALLNDRGEYDPSFSCQIDRFVTATSRFCPPGQDCDVLPGLFWGPLTETYCDQTTPWYSPARCECYNEIGEPWTKTRVPCSQRLGQNAMECHFYPWAHANRASDHYAVFGLPRRYGQWPMDTVFNTIFQGGGYGACSEAGDDGTPQLVGGGTIPVTIGDDFWIGQNGYEWGYYGDAEKIWRRITGQIQDYNPARIDVTHPYQWDPSNFNYDEDEGFRELGWYWFMGRADDKNGYPSGQNKALLDALIQRGYIQPYSNYTAGGAAQAIEPYQCNREGVGSGARLPRRSASGTITAAIGSITIGMSQPSRAPMIRKCCRAASPRVRGGISATLMGHAVSFPEIVGPTPTATLIR